VCVDDGDNDVRGSRAKMFRVNIYDSSGKRFRGLRRSIFFPVSAKIVGELCAKIKHVFLNNAVQVYTYHQLYASGNFLKLLGKASNLIYDKIVRSLLFTICDHLRFYNYINRFNMNATLCFCCIFLINVSINILYFILSPW